MKYSVILLLICLHAAASNAQQIRVSTGLASHSWDTGRDGFLECHLDNSGAGDAAGFEWTHNNGPALIDTDRISIERFPHLSRLRINDVRPSDAGQYQCTHQLAVNSLQFSVTVKTQPTFVRNQETEFNVPEGGDVILPCKVRNCQDCQVLWRKDSDILDDSTPTNAENIRTQSLTLTGVDLDDAGMYQCTIAQTDTHLWFTVRVLTYNERVPMLNKTHANSFKEVYYTDTLMLSCPVRSGENTTTNPLTVSWVFTNIHGELQHEVGRHLELAHYTRGLYKCTARNDIGEDSLEIFVEINAPPLPETADLPTVTFEEGSPRETVTYMPLTTPVALHELSYRWEMVSNGVWVQLPRGDKYTVSHNGVLTIENINLQDAGRYRVTITNEFGTSVQTRRVDVSPRPTPGDPVAIGFSFELPEGVSCNEVQATSDLLTSYLVDYLQSLCSSNDTALPDGACSDLQVLGVTVECPDSQSEGTFQAMLRAPSAQTVVEVFEGSGRTEVEHITIDPCGQAQCIIDPTVVTDLRNLLAVLVVVILLLVVAMVAIAVCVACCVCKHKKCCNRSRVADIESQIKVQTTHQLAQAYGTPSHNTLGTVQHMVYEQRYVECPTTKQNATYV